MTTSQVPTFQLLQWKYAIRLEAKGLKHSSGRSVYKHAKKMLNITGTRDAVITYIDKILEQRKIICQSLDHNEPGGCSNPACFKSNRRN